MNFGIWFARKPNEFHGWHLLCLFCFMEKEIKACKNLEDFNLQNFATSPELR